MSTAQFQRLRGERSLLYYIMILYLFLFILKSTKSILLYYIMILYLFLFILKENLHMYGLAQMYCFGQKWSWQFVVASFHLE